jgi:diguanylate cyclase (GGDEF)-like protein/PAS domain S-box-containing protein
MIFAVSVALMGTLVACGSFARWRREHRLRLEAEARLTEVEALARIGSWEFDLASDKILWSEETFRIFGLTPGTQEPDFADVLQSIHPEDRPRFDRAIQQAIGNRQSYQLDMRINCPDGVQKHVYAQGSPVCDGSEVVRLIGTILDITVCKQAETELEHRATYDVLTGLMNRGCLLERLESELALAHRRGETLSLCLCDVDSFKTVNDTAGHAAGDEILSGVGQLLIDGTRRGDLTGRLGGDEFCMVFPRTAPHEALICVERIRERLQAMAFGMSAGMAYSVTATFGIAQLRAGMLGSELREAADKALYEAKQLGRNCTVAST